MILKKQIKHFAFTIIYLIFTGIDCSLHASKQQKEIEGIEYVPMTDIELVKSELWLEISVFKRRRLLCVYFPPSYDKNEIKKEVEELKTSRNAVRYFRAVSRLIEQGNYDSFPSKKYSLFFSRAVKKQNNENGLMFCGTNPILNDQIREPVCAIRYSKTSGTLKFIDVHSWMDLKRKKEKQGVSHVAKK